MPPNRMAMLYMGRLSPVRPSHDLVIYLILSVKIKSFFATVWGSHERDLTKSQPLSVIVSLSLSARNFAQTVEKRAKPSEDDLIRINTPLLCKWAA